MSGGREDDTKQPSAIMRVAQKARMDFDSEIISLDEETQIATFRMRPSPRRYLQVEHEGRPHFLDRYLRTLVSFEDMADKMGGLPVFASPRSINSAPDYAAKRRLAVNHELETGEHEMPEERARQHDGLNEADLPRDIAFVSVDVCGSTAYRQRDPAGFDKAFQILLQELGAAVGHFHGTLLKTTGDGFIAFVDFPGFTVQCDSTIDLGLTLLVLLRDSVNPALAETGLQPLAIRVGADYGPALVREIRVPATGFAQLDITSDALNRAVKIEQSCEPGTFRIGYDLYQLVHVQWLERSTCVPFDGTAVGIPDYEVFEVH